MRLFRNSLIATLLTVPAWLLIGSTVGSAGCGGDDNACSDCDAFDTFQACYNEHHGTEGFTSDRAIEICCIDHPIGSAKMNVVCGDTTDSCKTYVTANLTDAADAMLTADITNACTNYPGDSGRTD